MNQYKVKRTTGEKFTLQLVGSNVLREYSKEDVMLTLQSSTSIMLTDKSETDGIAGANLFEPGIIDVANVLNGNNGDAPFATSDDFHEWWNSLENGSLYADGADVLTVVLSDRIVQLDDDRIAKGTVDYVVDADGNVTIFNISTHTQRTKPIHFSNFVDDLGAPLFATLQDFETWFSANFFFSLTTTIDPEVMEYKGAWDASTNTPTLSDTDGAPATGNLYFVSVAGTHDFGSGPIVFAVGDAVVYNGTVWEHGGPITATPNLNSVMTVGNTTTKQLSISAAAATFAADFQGSNTNFRLAILTGATGSGIQGYNNTLSAARFIYLQSSGGNIGIGTTADDTNAILNIVSTTKGILIPRGTTVQKNAIGSPSTPSIGMLFFDTDLGRLCEYTAAGWLTLATTLDLTTYQSATGWSYTSGTAATNNNSANFTLVTPGASKFWTVRVTYNAKSAGGRIYSGAMFAVGTTSGLGTVTVTGSSILSAAIQNFTAAVAVAVNAAGPDVVLSLTTAASDAAVTWSIKAEYFMQ